MMPHWLYNDSMKVSIRFSTFTTNESYQRELSRVNVDKIYDDTNKLSLYRIKEFIIFCA